MIKVIQSGSFDFGMPTATLVDIHSRGVDKVWMTKRAAVLTDQIKNIRPESGHSIIHLISMGAQEAYGCNRNGDGFNEKSGSFTLVEPMKGCPKVITMDGGLMQFHNPTFEKFAHVFKHHNNKDPKQAIGEVKAAAYNQDMRRGELLIKVPHNKEWNDDLEKLANGRDIPFSMACKVPYDICSYCGKRAATRGQYCDDLKDAMTAIVKSGEQVFAINDAPTFFDISKVIKPADRIAWSLQKVASDLAFPMGGAELAEMFEVSAPTAVLFEGGPAKYVRKLAAARKLAAIEKTIEGTAQSSDNQHLKQLSGGCPNCNMDDADLDKMRQSPLGSTLGALGSSKVHLSVRDFMKLVMGDKKASIQSDIPLVEGMLPGIYSRLDKEGGLDECASDSSYDGSDTPILRHIRELLVKIGSEHSLEYEPVHRRLRLAIIRGTSKSASLRPVKPDLTSKSAEVLAKEYVKYQLAYAIQDDCDLSHKLLVLKNYRG